MLSSFCEHDRLYYDCTFCEWNRQQAQIRANNAAYLALDQDQRMREGGGDD
jgi:hypothetical protein